MNSPVQQIGALTPQNLSPYNTFDPGYAPGSLNTGPTDWSKTALKEAPQTIGQIPENEVHVQQRALMSWLINSNPDQQVKIMGYQRMSPSAARVATNTGIVLNGPRTVSDGSGSCECGGCKTK